jgi:hypothetical protein
MYLPALHTLGGRPTGNGLRAYPPSPPPNPSKHNHETTANPTGDIQNYKLEEGWEDGREKTTIRARAFVTPDAPLSWRQFDIASI